MAISTLSGCRCIITGASRGIGAAIAHRFAGEGAKCTLIGRNQATLEALSASLLRDKFVEPNPHRIMVGDVADRSFWARLTVAERDVDVLVNAAGVTHYSLLVATQMKVVEEVVGTNLMGAVWGCQVMVKNLMRRKRGKFLVSMTTYMIV
jgi:short-subunit dehydrogenase